MGIMQLFNIVLFWIFFGSLSSYFAKKKGRNPLVWFFVGLLLGVFGLILLFFLPSVEKDKAAQPPSPSLSPIKSHEAWTKFWYYMDLAHCQQGPFELPELVKIWKNKEITERSLVWGEGMGEWRSLSDLPELIIEMNKD